MPNALLWGTVAAVLNFIPFLGPVTTLAILAIASVVTFSNIGQMLAVPGAFLGLHLIESRLVQPLLIGHRLELSALIILWPCGSDSGSGASSGYSARRAATRWR